jgi:hypothetical protein
MIDCTKNKNLQVGDKIVFILGSRPIDGTIIEKNNMSKGDINFLIQTDKGFVRIKHRNLDLYHIVGELNSQW